ncbi:MAG: isochorismatase family protein [Hyphomonadaceae bacterium]
MTTQDQSYSGVYNGELGFGSKPALILIDFVQAYFDPDCDLFADPQNALASAIRLKTIAEHKNIPVILTSVVYHKSFVNGGRFYQKAKPLRHFYEGSPLGRLPEGLELNGALMIEKQYPSAFFGTSLASTLTALGVDTVLLTGLTTSGCVRATCVDACSHGFIPIVVEDACADRHSAPHDANLFDMNAKYADVVDEAAAASYLETLNTTAQAGHSAQ